jgi:hypothetical protein
MWGGFTLYCGDKSLLIRPFIPSRPSRHRGNGIDHPEFDGIQECGRLAEFLPLASFSSLICGEGQSTASRSFSLTGYILLIRHVWNLFWM